MYLVIVEKRIVDKSFQYPVNFEKLQCFSYQLKSKGWSVLDCVPEKGGSFEVHFGNEMGEPMNSDEDKTFCVMLAHDAQSAIKCAGKATSMPASSDVGSIFAKLPESCVLIWHETMSNADRFLIKG